MHASISRLLVLYPNAFCKRRIACLLLHRSKTVPYNVAESYRMVDVALCVFSIVNSKDSELVAASVSSDSSGGAARQTRLARQTKLHRAGGGKKEEVEEDEESTVFASLFPDVAKIQSLAVELSLLGHLEYVLADVILLYSGNLRELLLVVEHKSHLFIEFKSADSVRYFEAETKP